MMARHTRFTAAFVAMYVLALLAGCGDRSLPEDQVRAWLAAVQEAAEAKNRGDVIERISPAYSDSRGNSRDDIENLLRVYFLRQNTIALLVSVDELTIVGGTAAEVSLTVGMAGTNNRALGINADAYHFELELIADGDDWQLISLRWGELGQPLR